MSGKLIIHKIEDEINFKSLQIYFEQSEDKAVDKYSGWMDGKVEVKTKDKGDPGVLVKVAIEEESYEFDLDYCARKVKEETILDIFKYYETDKYRDDFDKVCYSNSLDYFIGQRNRDNGSLCLTKDTTEKSKNIKSHTLENFLEHSLIKVKENNARIMEKIQMLNRTLNFITNETSYVSDTNANAVRSHTCSECEKCFVYETGLRRHLYLRHGNSNWPRWQTVWTCTECFQVWPQYDGAIAHGKSCSSSNNADIVRDMKTSLLLQCEFCEIVFSCIPKLLRHYKDHTVKYNYECKGCAMVFESYKSAEQHWMHCPWLMQHYTFSLPKMLLCSTCDRKFKNYEQLYNHRYKAGHYMGKSIEKDDFLNIAYQCEACGQYFGDTPKLEDHRNQRHPQLDCAVTL